MEGDVLFAGGFLFVPGFHPVFPMLAGGAVFASEFEAGDFGVRNFALVSRLGREVLHPGVGQRGAGGAIEDVGFNLLAGLERERDVAAIIEGFFESVLQVLIAGERGNLAFQLFVLKAGSELEGFDLFARVFLNFSGHIFLSESALGQFALRLRDLHQR